MVRAALAAGLLDPEAEAAGPADVAGRVDRLRPDRVLAALEALRELGAAGGERALVDLAAEGRGRLARGHPEAQLDRLLARLHHRLRVLGELRHRRGGVDGELRP